MGVSRWSKGESTFGLQRYDDIIAEDEEGLVLANDEAARLQAFIGARDIIAEQVKHGYFNRSHWIDVLDEQQKVLFTVRFAEAVDIK